MKDKDSKDIQKKTNLDMLNESYLSRICPRCQVSLMYQHPEAHRIELRKWFKCAGCGFAKEKNDY